VRFFTELKRRNVLRMALLLTSGWLNIHFHEKWTFGAGMGQIG
jgi:hypothetical protein